MKKFPFYLAFAGSATRFDRLKRFFDRLVSVKSTLPEVPPDGPVLDAIICDAAWLDLLDSETVERFTEETSAGALEDVLACILNGEYELLDLTFDGQFGRLYYDPWAGPFGGTWAFHALLTNFGFLVTWDSWDDGAAEWSRRRQKK